MKKRAQEVFGLSFGIIFSIIITIAIIASAFFAIKHFLGINKCAQIGLFYNDFQNEIDRAWNSGTYTQRYFGNSLPNEIKFVCFGNLALTAESDSASIRSELESLNPADDANIFFYPPKECPEIFSNRLEHTDIQQFFCKPVSDGKLTSEVVIKFNDLEDNLVKISRS